MVANENFIPEIPLLYHAHHSRHLEDIPFWLHVVSQNAGVILELGCGTGRVSLPLARAGQHIYGLDTDAGMLAVLRIQLTPATISMIHLIQGDLTCFRFAEQFMAIIIPCNTISTLPVHALPGTLSNIYHHLQPQGLFAASLPNPELLLNLPAHSESEIEESFPHPLDGEPVQVSSAWRHDKKQFTIFWHYDHLLPNGGVQRTSVQARHSILPLNAYVNLFHEAGFSKITTYGDFIRTPYTSDSPNLILLASK